MRSLIDRAHRVRRWLLRVTRWRTRGVKVAAFDGENRVLLVRHRYGRTDLWMLPGGGMRRREMAIAAAAREVREETGCVLTQAALVGTFQARAEGRRDTVHLVRGNVVGEPRADLREIAEAAMFALDALPEKASAATLRRLDELAGKVAPTGRW